MAACDFSDLFNGNDDDDDDNDSGGSLVGVWQDEASTVLGYLADATIEFRSDGMFLSQGVIEWGTYTVSGNTITLTVFFNALDMTETAKYSISGNRLTLSNNSGTGMGLLAEKTYLRVNL
jgi:hypothetical protein